MTLRDWLLNDWLRPHKTNPGEIAALFSLIDRDLADCQTAGLSADGRLNIAYNAALQAANVALAASGYRAGHESHHYRIIQSLTQTIGAPADLVAHLDQFRKKRNIGEYERAGVASDQEAREMFFLAKKLRDDVAAWLHANHPGLIKE